MMNRVSAFSMQYEQSLKILPYMTVPKPTDLIILLKYIHSFSCISFTDARSINFKGNKIF